MADTQVTLRPNGTPSSGSWVNTGGAPSFHAALSDDSDSTFATPADATYLFLAFDDPAVPALAVVHSVRVRVRAAGGAGQTGVASLKDAGSGATYSLSGTYGGSGAQATYTLASDTAHFTTTAALGNLQVFLQADVGCDVAEVYVDVFYNRAPTAVVLAPTGIVIDSSNPTVDWAYSDPEGDTQERYEVKIFDVATYGDAGFNIDTSHPIYDSGDAFSATPSVTPPPIYSFPNGTYRAYVKVADVGSAGRYGPWGYSQYTVGVLPAAVPTITAVADDATASVSLLVQARDNRLTTNQASLETDTTGWAAFAGCTIARTTFQQLSGAASLQLTATAAGDMIATTPIGTSGIAVVPGETVTAVCSFFRGGSVGRNCRVAIAWYSSGGVSVGGYENGTTVDDSVWNQSSVTVVVPPGAAYARVEPRVLSVGGIAEVHYIDQISLAGGSSTVWTRGGLFNPSLRVYVDVSLDGGVTWAHLTQVAVGVDEKAPIQDYAAVRGVLLHYRAHTVATPDGTHTLVSAYTLDATAFLTALAAWLKDPDDPILNRAVCLVSPPLVSTSSEPQQPFSGLGDPYWSVSSDVAKGEVGDLTLSFDGDAAFGAFEALRRPSRTLLLQTGYGDGGGEQMYVRLGADRTVTRLPVKADGLQARIVTVGYRQVREPA